MSFDVSLAQNDLRAGTDMTTLVREPLSRDAQAILAFQSRKKSVAAAYILWVFFGLFGAHRFYLGRTGSAVLMLLLSVSVVGLIVTIFWVFVDAFLIPRMTEERNDELRYLLSL